MRAVFGALGLAGLAAVAAGCFGTAAPAAPAAISVVVRYAIEGRTVSAPAMLRGDCPAQARCRAMRIPGSRPRRWELIATRRLACNPDHGGYARPAIACEALRDLARLEARRPHRACMCPLELAPIPTAVGRIERRHVSFHLDPCSVCSLGGRSAADIRILIPH